MSDTNAYSTSLLTRCRKHILALIAVLAVLVGGTGTASATGICDLDNSVGCEATADCIAELGGGTCIEATGGGDILQAATNTIGCMGDVFNAFGQGGELNCTANDVTVTAISDVETLDGCDAPGDTATISFVAKFEINGGVQRHDVGVYVAADGGDALSDACGLDGFCVNHPTACVADSDCPGSCSIITFPYEPDGLGDPWLDLDGSLATCSLRPTLTCEKDSDCAAGGGVKCDDPDSTGTNTCSNARAVACTTVADCDFGICTGAAVQDTCGDVSGTLDPFYWYVTNIVLECNDVDGDGNLDVNGCLSWRQPGADELCTDPLNVFPGSPSKCNCQGLPGIPVPVPGQIIVDKVTVDFNGDPLSGDATVFDFSITGPDSDLPDAFTLVDGAAHSSPGLGTSCIEGVCSGNSSLVCSLDSECNSYSVTESAEAGWEVVSESTTCVSDQGNADQDPIAGALTLNPGETLTCTFTNKRLLTPPDLTVQKDNDADLDDDFNDTEEAGGVPVTVPYQVMITNNSISDATITSIGDDTHDITGSSCAGLLNTTILAGETLTCTFDHTFTQDNRDVTNEFTVTAENGAGSDTASDTSRVIIPDIQPQNNVTLTKTADPIEVDEPGGDVTFTVTVVNSGMEALTLSALNDDIYGDIAASGNANLVSTTCSVPQALAANDDAPGGPDEYTCSFVAPVSGNAGESQTDTVTGTVTDDDGNEFEPFDDATVTITDVPSSATLTKSADPTSVDEPGGDVTFTVRVDNTSAVDDLELAVLSDDIYGDLTVATDTTCMLPQTIAAGGFYECTFTGAVSGNAGDSQIDTVTATLTDNDGNTLNPFDDATVTVVGVDPSIVVTKTADPVEVNEPGDTVTFSVSIENTSVAGDPVTIDTLNDSIHGDLTLADNSTCTLPQTIQPDDTYSCSFTAAVNGNAGDSETNVATASGQDDDGTPVSDDDDATVTVVGMAPVVALTKLAVPETLSEPGGDFVFTLTITNNSNASDPITIDTLTDTQSGDAADFSQCAALVGTTLPPGDSTSCQYTVTHTQAGTYNNTAAVEVTDDEGTSANDSADESVEVTNVLPDISVVKTANPANLVFPGGVVTFEIVVTNNSNPADTVTITSMLDDVYGNLFDTSDAKPQLTAVSCDIYSIPPGTSATCTFDVNFSLSIGDEIFLTETDEVTVTAVDEEGSSDFDSDDAIVTITPPIFFTNSSLCTFDTRDDIEDRQWRRILTQDVQQWPDFKFGATNPGQFFYNLSISGESCDEPDPADCPTQIAELTLEFSWPFVTQGSKALHAWHGVDIYYVQDDLGNEQICYCPGYNSVNESGECEPADPVASCDFEITLADYSAVIDSRSGYTEHGDGSWTADTWSFPVATYAPGCVLELPDDGFLYVNQHLDDGLKGPDIDVDAIIPGLTPDDGVDDRYSKYLQEHAVDPATLADTDPAVLMPELAIHTFTMTATVDGDIQTGSDSVQNDNEFKKNPGVAGRVTLGTTASGDAVDVGDEVEIHLTDPEGNPVGSCDGKVDRRGNDNGSACFGFDWTDSDGWWQIIYKHKGKPAMYTIDVVFPASYDNCYADDTDWSCGSTGSDWVCTKQERLKGNAFSEVNLELFLGDMITACDPTL